MAKVTAFGMAGERLHPLDADRDAGVPLLVEELQTGVVVGEPKAELAVLVVRRFV